MKEGSTILEMLNRGKSTVENNSFDLIDVLADTDFLSLDETELLKERKADGSLPDINFLRLTSDAELRFWGMGCFASNDASKLKFDWLKKPTIVVVGNRASVVGPNADQFTKIYVNKNGEEQEDAYDKTADLSSYSGILNLKATVEDANGNVTSSITLKIKR